MRFVFCYNGHLRKMPQKTQFRWFWFLKSFALHIMDNVMIRWRCFLAVHWNWQYCECFCCQTHVLHVTVKLLHVIHLFSQFCVYQHCIAHILPHVLFCNTLSCVFENQCSAMLCFVFCTRLWSVVDAFERAVLCVLPVCLCMLVYTCVLLVYACVLSPLTARQSNAGDASFQLKPKDGQYFPIQIMFSNSLCMV